MQRVVRAIRGHWQLLVLIAVIFALWSTPLVTPLKILTVFLHELSHALVTLLTGGSVESLTIDRAQGGAVWSRGGNRFLILSAGYCGSLMIGVTLFVAAVQSGWDRLILGALGALILLVTAFYVRDMFAIGFGVLTGVVMILAARFLNPRVSDLALRVIGLTSMIYVPYDIVSDTILRSNLQSDARMLAQEFAGPTLFWGGLWLVLSLVSVGCCFRFGLGQDSNITFGQPHSDHNT